MTRRDDSYKLRDEVKPQVNYTVCAPGCYLRCIKNKIDSLPQVRTVRSPTKKVLYLCNKFDDQPQTQSGRAICDGARLLTLIIAN